MRPSKVCILERLVNGRKVTKVFTGYSTFFPNATDYDVDNSPRSWALVPAVRHAMTLHPYSTYFFILSPHALVMNPSLSLNTHIMAPKRMESIMLKDKPVVPPDSVIKTFSHLKGDKIDLVLTQDNEGLCQGSFILRSGDWAKFFLDTWFDPLYRSYNFQKAEGHALVCQRLFNPPSGNRNQKRANKLTGTHCAMAPHHPNQISLGTTTAPKFLQHRHSKQGRPRSHVQRRRLHPTPGRLRA